MRLQLASLTLGQVYNCKTPDYCVSGIAHLKQRRCRGRRPPRQQCATRSCAAAAPAAAATGKLPRSCRRILRLSLHPICKFLAYKKVMTSR